MVVCPLQQGTNPGQKLLDTPTLRPMPSIRCLLQAASQDTCPPVSLGPVQSCQAKVAWPRCWKAQKCWRYSSFQPPLDPPPLPLIHTWDSVSSLGPRKELAEAQLSPLSHFLLDMSLSCHILFQTMSPTGSLPSRHTHRPKAQCY